MDRRQFLQRAAGALVSLYLDMSGIPMALGAIPTGKITTPIAQFTRMSDPLGDAFEGVKDPLGSGATVVKNLHRPGGGDDHRTMGTYRDLPVGSTSYCAFDWLYMPGEFEQTARNLIWQNQQSGSPIAAISTDRKTDKLALVDRLTGSERRAAFAPIPWGHWFQVVIGVKMADKGGYVEMWYAVDGWPDVSKPPLLRRDGDTYQGATGHNTIGMYAQHTNTTPYTGYFRSFGRDVTAQGAIDHAR